MTEPLSIAASIIALGTAVNGTTKITKSLWRTCKVIKTAREDIETFTRLIENYAIAVRTVQRVLKDLTSSKRLKTKPKVFSYVEDKKGLSCLTSESKRITKGMLSFMRAIRKLRGRGRIVVGFKWMMMKKEIETQLKPVMESTKSNLHLVVTRLQLGVLLEMAEASGESLSAEDLREIENLREEIRIHQRTIKHLNELLDSRPIHQTQPTHQSQPTFSQNFQEEFFELATSLVFRNALHGSPTVKLPRTSSSFRRTRSPRSSILTQRSRPDSRQQSTTSTTSTQITRRTSSTSLEREPLFIRRSSSVSSRQINKKPISISIPPIRRLRPQRNDEVPQQDTLFISEQSPSLPMAETSSVSEVEVEIEIGAPSPSSSRPNTNESSTSEVETTAPSPTSQSDFISTYPKSYLLHLNPTHNMESKSGFIHTSAGSVSVTALIDHDLNENIISQAYAAKLGLEYNETDGEEEENEDDNQSSWIDFGDGQKEKKLGTVTLRWTDGKTREGRSFPVQCWVCEHGIRDLILGKPFLEKREHYQNPRGKGPAVIERLDSVILG